MSSEAKAKFEWDNEVNFKNIIAALFNNWPEMNLVVDRTSGDSRITVYTDIKKFIQDVFDCLLIYGTGRNDRVSAYIKKCMLDDFHMVIEDFAAKEMSTRICSMYDKWINQDSLAENHKQVITEIKNLSKPYPIVEFEDLPRCKITFETDEIMC